MLLLAAGALFLNTSGAVNASNPTTNPISAYSLGSAVTSNLPKMPAAPTDTPSNTPTKTPLSCSLAWSIVTSPSPGRGDNELLGVTAVAANDVWAVGYQYDHLTLTEHWDGGEWSVVPSPNIGAAYKNELTAVAALSAGDIWAVGHYYNGSAWQTLVENGKGRDWTVIPSPNVGGYDNYLTGVAAVSSHDVWAVGRYYNGSSWQTLVEHWDGTGWSVVPSPNVGAGSNQLSGIVAISANDVWAVGHYYIANYVPQTLVEHWDGTEWSKVYSPNVGVSTNQLSAISAVSANDIWAVGRYYDGSSWQTLVEHWDGTGWSVVPSANVPTKYSFLNAVAAVSANDIWAVGYYDTGSGKYENLAEHWDGIEWSVVPSPNAGLNFDYLNGVAAVSTGDIWAVGEQSSTGKVDGTLVEHYVPSCTLGTPTTPPTVTPGSTLTPTPTPTATSMPTAPPAPALLVGHVTWQGPPAQPNTKQALPISITLRLQTGGPMEEISGLTTDSSGNFTATVDLASGSYQWRVKGPKYLAASGSVFLSRGTHNNVEIGLMSVADANDDNAVTVRDFIILKNSFGKAFGQNGYDDRANFTGDITVNALDFNLLRTNFGNGGAPSEFTDLTTPSLLDRARLHGWRDLGYLHNAAFRESDITYDTVTGKYYVFSTGSYTGTGAVYMYVASTPEDLVAATPITVAVGVYPSIVKDPTTGYWHLYAEKFTNGVIQHFISTSAPDSPTSFELQPAPINFQVIDTQVRKHPMNGKWYAVGFPTGNNQPLTILWANGPNGGANGLWTPLGEVFADTQPPPWAGFARPDPNLAFTSDGRAWVFFTGNAQSPIVHRSAVVEVDLSTGKAKGSAVALSSGAGTDPLPGWYDGANLSDLNLVSVPNQPDRIFAFSCDGPGPYFGTLDMHWGVMDLDPIIAPSDGRASTDLVRLDGSLGFDTAAGIQATLLGDSSWSSAGLIVDSNNGGAYSYLAAAKLGDLTETVDFTVSSIRAGAINEIANIGGHDYTHPPGIDIQIDANGEIVAVVTGSDTATVTLHSGTTAQVGGRYLLSVHRVGSTLALSLNGTVKDTQSFGSVMGDLEGWSLGAQARITQAARYPFSGTIHSFLVVGTGF